MTSSLCSTGQCTGIIDIKGTAIAENIWVMDSTIGQAWLVSFETRLGEDERTKGRIISFSYHSDDLLERNANRKNKREYGDRIWMLCPCGVHIKVSVSEENLVRLPGRVIAHIGTSVHSQSEPETEPEE